MSRSTFDLEAERLKLQNEIMELEEAEQFLIAEGAQSFESTMMRARTSPYAVEGGSPSSSMRFRVPSPLDGSHYSPRLSSRSPSPFSPYERTLSRRYAKEILSTPTSTLSEATWRDRLDDLKANHLRALIEDKLTYATLGKCEVYNALRVAVNSWVRGLHFGFEDEADETEEGQGRIASLCMAKMVVLRWRHHISSHRYALGAAYKAMRHRYIGLCQTVLDSWRRYVDARNLIWHKICRLSDHKTKRQRFHTWRRQLARSQYVEQVAEAGYERQSIRAQREAVHAWRRWMSRSSVKARKLRVATTYWQDNTVRSLFSKWQDFHTIQSSSASKVVKASLFREYNLLQHSFTGFVERVRKRRVLVTALSHGTSVLIRRMFWKWTRCAHYYRELRDKEITIEVDHLSRLAHSSLQAWRSIVEGKQKLEYLRYTALDHFHDVLLQSTFNKWKKEKDSAREEKKKMWKAGRHFAAGTQSAVFEAFRWNASRNRAGKIARLHHQLSIYELFFRHWKAHCREEMSFGMLVNLRGGKHRLRRVFEYWSGFVDYKEFTAERFNYTYILTSTVVQWTTKLRDWRIRESSNQIVQAFRTMTNLEQMAEAVVLLKKRVESQKRLKKALRSWQGSLYRQCFRAIVRFADQSQRKQSNRLKYVNYLVNSRLQKTWLCWVQYVLEAGEKYEKMEKATTFLWGSTQRRMFGLWKHNARSTIAVDVLKNVAAKMKNAELLRAFEGWYESYETMLEKKAKRVAALSKWVNGTMSRCFDTWAESAVDSMEKRILATRAVHFFRGNKLAQGVALWHNNAATLKAKRNAARKALGFWTNATMSRCFEAISTFAVDVMTKQDMKTRAVKHMLHSQMARGWRRIDFVVNARKERRAKLRKAMSFMQFTTSRKCFSVWRFEVKEAKWETKLLKKALKWMTSGTFARCFRAFKIHTVEEQEKRRSVSKALSWMADGLRARCFRKWVKAMELKQEKLRQATRALSWLSQGIVKRCFARWLKLHTDVKEKWRKGQQAISWLVNHTAKKCAVAWRKYAVARIAKRNKKQRALKWLVGDVTSRCFSKWLEYTQTEKETARNAVKAMAWLADSLRSRIVFKWRRYTEYQIESRIKMSKAAIVFTGSHLKKTWNTWKAMVAYNKRNRSSITKALAWMSSTMRTKCFHVWKFKVKSKVEVKGKAKRVVARMRHSDLHSGWLALTEHVELKKKLRQATHWMKNLVLIKCFNSWYDIIRWINDKKEKSERVVTIIQNNGVSRAWKKWNGVVDGKKMIAKAVFWMSSGLLIRCFNSWKNLLQILKEKERLMTKALGWMTQALLGRCFHEWHLKLLQAQEDFYKSQKALQWMMADNKRKMFARWQLYQQIREEKLKKAHKALSWLSHGLQNRCVLQWKKYMGKALEKKRKKKKALAMLTSATLVRCVRRLKKFRDLANEAQRQKLRAASWFMNISLRRGFNKWEDFKLRKAEQKNKQIRAISWMTDGTLKKCFEKLKEWRKLCKEKWRMASKAMSWFSRETEKKCFERLKNYRKRKVVKGAQILRALKYWVNDTKTQCFRRWLSYVTEIRLTAKALFWLRSTLTMRCLNQWKYYLTYKGEKVASKKRAFAWLNNGLLVRCFRGWIEYVDVTRRASLAAHRWRNASLVRGLNKWSGVVNSRGLLHIVVKHWKQLAVKRGLKQWRQRTKDIQHVRKGFRRAMSYWKGGNLRKTFSAWTAFTRVSAVRTNKMKKAISFMSNRMSALCFHEWRERTDYSGWKSQAALIAVKRWKMTNTAWGFYRWGDNAHERKQFRKAMNRWSKANLVKSFTTLHENTHRSKRKAISSQMAIGRWTNSSLTKCFFVLQDNMFWQQHKKYVLNKCTRRLMNRTLSMCFLSFKNLLEEKAAAANNAVKAVKHWQNQSLASAFDFLSHRGQRGSEKKGKKLKAFSCWKNQNLLKGWNWWVETVEAKLRYKRQMKTAVSRWNQRGLTYGLNTWRDVVDDKVNRKVMLSRAGRLWMSQTVAKGWRMLLDYREMVREKKASVSACVGHWKNQSLSRGFVRWNERVAESRDRKHKLQVAGMKWTYGAVTKSFSRWQEHNSELLGQRKALAMFRNTTVLKCFNALRETIQDKLRQKQLMLRAVQHQVVSAIRLWHNTVAMKKAGRKWRNAIVVKSFNSWKAFVATIHDKLDKGELAALRWLHSTLSRSLLAWAVATDHSLEKKRRVKKAMSYWTNGHMVRCFGNWKKMVAGIVDIRMKGYIAVARWSNKALSASFAGLKTHLQNCREKTGKMRKALAFFKDLAVVHCFDAWARVKEIREENERKSRGALARLMNKSLSKCMVGWQLHHQMIAETKTKAARAIGAWRMGLQSRVFGGFVKNLEDVRSHANQLNSAVAHWQNQELAAAVLKWQNAYLDGLSRKARYRKAMSFWTNALPKRCIQNWRKAVVQGQKYRSILYRLTNKLAFQAMESWKEWMGQVWEKKKKTAVAANRFFNSRGLKCLLAWNTLSCQLRATRSILNRILNRVVVQCLNRWVEFWGEQMEKKEKVRKALGQWRHKMLNLIFTEWAMLARHKADEESALLHTTARMLTYSMLRSLDTQNHWFKWKSYTRFRKLKKWVVEEWGARVNKRLMLWVWNPWANRTTWRAMREKKKKIALIQWKRGSLRSGWDSWVQWHQRRSLSNSKSFVALSYWSGNAKALYFQRFQEGVEVWRKTKLAFLRKWQLKGAHKALLSWKDWLEQTYEKYDKIQRAVSFWYLTGKYQAFQAWLAYLQYKHERLNVSYDAVNHWANRSFIGAIRKWKHETDQKTLRKRQMKAAVLCWNDSLLFRVLHALKTHHYDKQDMRYKMESSIEFWQGQSVRGSLLRWHNRASSSARKRRELHQKLRKSLSHWSMGMVRRSFNNWSSKIDCVLSDRVVRLRKAVSYLKDRKLRIAFDRFTESLELSRASKKRLFARFCNRLEARSFDHLVRYTRDRREKRDKLEASSDFMLLYRADRAIAHWKEYVLQRISHKSKLQSAVKCNILYSRLRGFVRWRKRTELTKQNRLRIAVAIDHWWTQSVAWGFERWTRRSEEAKDRRVVKLEMDERFGSKLKLKCLRKLKRYMKIRRIKYELKDIALSYLDAALVKKYYRKLKSCWQPGKTDGARTHSAMVLQRKVLRQWHGILVLKNAYADRGREKLLKRKVLRRLNIFPDFCLVASEIGTKKLEQFGVKMRQDAELQRAADIHFQLSCSWKFFWKWKEQTESSVIKQQQQLKQAIRYRRVYVWGRTFEGIFQYAVGRVRRREARQRLVEQVFEAWKDLVIDSTMSQESVQKQRVDAYRLWRYHVITRYMTRLKQFHVFHSVLKQVATRHYETTLRSRMLKEWKSGLVLRLLERSRKEEPMLVQDLARDSVPKKKSRSRNRGFHSDQRTITGAVQKWYHNTVEQVDFDEVKAMEGEKLTSAASKWTNVSRKGM